MNPFDALIQLCSRGFGFVLSERERERERERREEERKNEKVLVSG